MEYVNTPEVLHGLGIAPDAGPLRFTFERDGVRFERELAPISVSAYVRAMRNVLQLIPQAITGRVPKYISNRGKIAVVDEALVAPRLLPRLQRDVDSHGAGRRSDAQGGQAKADARSDRRPAQQSRREQRDVRPAVE